MECIKTSIFKCVLMLFLLTIDTTTVVLSQYTISQSPNPGIVGSDVSLTCTWFESSSPFLVTWTVSGGTSDIFNVIHGSCTYSGEARPYSLSGCSTVGTTHTAVLTISPAASTDNGNQWACSTANGAATAISLDILVPITSVQLTSPATDQVSVIENVPYMFNCDTSTGRPAAKISWYKRMGSNAQQITSVVTPGTRPSGDLTITTSRLEYTASRSDEGHEIYCQATHVTSTVFTSSRKPLLTILYAPSVAALQDQRVIVLTPFTQTCSVTEGRPLGATVNWTRSGDSSWSQAGRTLSLNPVTKADTAVYTCTSSNVMTPTGGITRNGSDAKTFTLTIMYAPSVAALQDQSVIASTQFTLTCSVTDGRPSGANVVWTRSGDSGWSQAGRTLSLNPVVKVDAVVYTCTASNVMIPTGGTESTGSDSKNFTLTVFYPPTINAIPDRSVVAHSPLTVTCQTNPGKPSATLYRWTRSKDSWSQDGATLTIQIVQKAAADVYTCTAWNVMEPTVGTQRNGTDTETFTLNVLYPPTINAIQDRSVVAESSLTVVCNSNPGNPTETTYRWTRSKDSWSQDGATLRIPSVQKDASVYTCTAWNVMIPTGGPQQNGTDTETFTLNVLYPPTINAIQDRSVVAESSLTVVCNSSPGYPPETTYRWTRSTDSWSQDGATLRIQNVHKAAADVYKCTAWNVMKPTAGPQMNGEDTETFTLDVLYQTAITEFRIAEESGTSPYTVEENSTGTFECSVESNPASNLTISGSGGMLTEQSNKRVIKYAKALGCLDAGMYECRGHNYLNGADRPSTNLHLRVRCHPRPSGSVEPIIKVYKGLHDPVTLNVSYIAYPPPTFKWFKLRSSYESDEYDPLPSETQRTFTIDDLKEADFRKYKVEVANNIAPNYEQAYIIETQDAPEAAGAFGLGAAIGGGAGATVAVIVGVVVVVVVVVKRRHTAQKDKDTSTKKSNISDSPVEDETGHQYYNLRSNPESTGNYGGTSGQPYEDLRTTTKNSQLYDQLHPITGDTAYINEDKGSTYEQLDTSLKQNDGVYDDIRATQETRDQSRGDRQIYVNMQLNN